MLNVTEEISNNDVSALDAAKLESLAKLNKSLNNIGKELKQDK